MQPQTSDKINYDESPLFYNHNGISIYNDTVLNTTLLERSSIDIIVTSPPYNVGIDYNSNDDGGSYSKYLQFTEAWIRNCYFWAKSSCRFILNIPLDKNKGGHQSVGADVTLLAKKIGWQYHSTLIWNEGNISRRTAWGSWMSASAPYVIAPVELIVVLYKGDWKKTNGTRKSDITRDEFMQWTNGVWTFNGESKKRIGHPAPFPRELPRRAIKLFSFVGDTVLDPFMGSGTTLIECKLNNRLGVGIDIDKQYCTLATNRIAFETSQSSIQINQEEN